MKIEEQFFVVKNLTTGQYIFNTSSGNHVYPGFTSLLTSAKCFESVKHAEAAIENVRLFWTNNQEKSGYGKLLKNSEFLIFQLTRTHAITKEFHP